MVWHYLKILKILLTSNSSFVYLTVLSLKL